MFIIASSLVFCLKAGSRHTVSPTFSIHGSTLDLFICLIGFDIVYSSLLLSSSSSTSFEMRSSVRRIFILETWQKVGFIKVFWQLSFSFDWNFLNSVFWSGRIWDKIRFSYITNLNILSNLFFTEGKIFSKEFSTSSRKISFWIKCLNLSYYWYSVSLLKIFVKQNIHSDYEIFFNLNKLK